MIILLLSLAHLCVPGLTQDVMTVSTTLGDVTGKILPVTSSLDTDVVVNVTSFWAIPYVAPPLGDLRFAKPASHAGWTEPYEAFTPGSVCPQDSRIIWYTHPLWNDYDEDCLHLNVFTPTDAEPGSLPVMVYFHGGAYVNSGNIQYPGYFLAMKDVVVVGVNYRLGVLGFLSTDGYLGNWAMYDQTASLEWVRDNIAGFGGDPDRVTIFGHSAGASSVGLHMVSQVSQDLYNQAICQSGSDIAYWAANFPQQNPDSYADQVAEDFDCSNDDKDSMIECLREQDAHDLAAFNITCTEGYFCQGFAPVLDGDGGFLHDYPYHIREAGEHKNCPLMSGQTTDDGALYTASFIPETMDRGLTREEFLYHLEHTLLGIWEAQVTEQQFQDMFEAFAYYYSPWPHIESMDDNREAVNVLLTDLGFGYPGDAQIKLHQPDQPDIWHYLMGFRGPNTDQLFPEWMGVPHMGELPYVWGYPFLTMPENEHLRDDCLITFDIIPWTSEDIEYSEFMTQIWTNFAKSANPNEPEPIPMPFGLEPVEWLRYNNNSYDYYMMAEDVTQENEYRQRSFSFITQYIGYIIDQNMLTGLPNEQVLGKSRGGGLDSRLADEMISDHIEALWTQRMAS